MKRRSVWIGFILLLAIWQLLYLFLDSRLVPEPLGTLIVLGRQILSGELLIHSVYSGYRLIIAVCLALVVGVVTGIVIGMNKPMERIFTPLIYIMFPVPKAALLPIIFVLFGLGDGSKIILIWLILYFQIVLAVYDAVKVIDKDVLIAARTLRLTRYDLYRHVVLPAILPSVLSALRTSVGIGIAVLFFAETYATSRGLGYYIMNQWSLLNYKEMYAGILFLGGFGYVVFKCIDVLKTKLVQWK